MMKLYKLKLDHNDDNIDKEFHIACNTVNEVIDYAKSLSIHHLDYEIKSIELNANNVIIPNDFQS